ncbi:MAG: STAS domain-containing protein [Deltaproteobacteria bacterium]|nr:STAS domain-containing protein [Deltaproteobacteria bacterium]
MSTTHAGGVTLKIDGELTIAVARTTAGQWHEAVRRAGPVVVDVERLGKVDTAGLQLLLSLKRTCEESNRTFLWQGNSASLQDAATRCGLADELGLKAGD